MSPSQMVQTISVDVGDFKAVEKATSEAVAKLGPVQVGIGVGGYGIRDELGEARRAGRVRSAARCGAVRCGARRCSNFSAYTPGAI